MEGYLTQAFRRMPKPLSKEAFRRPKHLSKEAHLKTAREFLRRVKRFYPSLGPLGLLYDDVFTPISWRISPGQLLIIIMTLFLFCFWALVVVDIIKLRRCKENDGRRILDMISDLSWARETGPPETWPLIFALLVSLLREIFALISSGKRPYQRLFFIVALSGCSVALSGCSVALSGLSLVHIANLKGCKKKVAWRKWGMISWFLDSPCGTLSDNPSSHDSITAPDGSFTSSHASPFVDHREDNATLHPNAFRNMLPLNQPLLSEPNPSSHDSIYTALDGTFNSSRASPSVDREEDNATLLPYASGNELPPNQPPLSEPNPSSHDSIYIALDGSFNSSRASPFVESWEHNAILVPNASSSELPPNQPLLSEPNPSSHDSIYTAPDESFTSSRASPSMDRWEDNTALLSSDLPQNQPVLSMPNPRPLASFFKKLLDWFFTIAILLLEVPLQVFNQISSKERPDLGLVGTALSFAILLVCIIELIYRGRKEKIAWRKYWFFRPNGSPFGTPIDMAGLICSIWQCFVASIAYASFRNHDNEPIKISVSSIISAFFLLVSKIYQQKSNSEP